MKKRVKKISGSLQEFNEQGYMPVPRTLFCKNPSQKKIKDLLLSMMIQLEIGYVVTYYNRPIALIDTPQELEEYFDTQAGLNSTKNLVLKTYS